MLHVGVRPDFRARGEVLRVTVTGPILQDAGFRRGDPVDVMIVRSGALLLTLADPEKAAAEARTIAARGWATRRLRAASFGGRAHCWRKDGEVHRRAGKR
ncbi:MAG: hypothetical protein ABSA52_00430 [Candidatus Binatia bacterium]|jgi:hypothetical protein